MLLACRLQRAGIYIAQGNNLYLRIIVGNAFHRSSAHATHPDASHLQHGIRRSTAQNRRGAEHGDSRGGGMAKKFSAFHGTIPQKGLETATLAVSKTVVTRQPPLRLP